MKIEVGELVQIRRIEDSKNGGWTRQMQQKYAGCVAKISKVRTLSHRQTEGEDNEKTAVHITFIELEGVTSQFGIPYTFTRDMLEHPGTELKRLSSGKPAMSSMLKEKEVRKARDHQIKEVNFTDFGTIR